MDNAGGTFYRAGEYSSNPSDQAFEIVATFPGINGYYDYDATNDFSLISGTPTATGDLQITSFTLATPGPGTFGIMLLGTGFLY